MLVIPRNVLVDEKEAFFKGAVLPFLSIPSNSGPVVTTIANVFSLSLDVPQGGIDCNHTPLIAELPRALRARAAEHHG